MEEFVQHITKQNRFHRSPLTYAWQGGVRLSEQPDFLSKCMTREEYDEEGVRGAYDRFDV